MFVFIKVIFVFHKWFENFYSFCLPFSFSSRAVFSRISNPWNDTTPSVGTKIVLWCYYPPIWFLFTYHRNNRILGNFFLFRIRRIETECRAIFVEEFYCNLLTTNYQYWDLRKKRFISNPKNNYPHLITVLVLNAIFKPVHDSALTDHWSFGWLL